jgi:hypothetical protein
LNFGGITIINISIITEAVVKAMELDSFQAPFFVLKLK